MKYILLSCLICFSTMSNGAVQSPTPEEFQTLLNLDYKSFDQTLPNGGWRGIVDKVDAGKVLDSYHIHNLEKLEPWQARIIYWHAGQEYAMSGLSQLALARFKKSFNPDQKADDTFRWNSYVKGSIAFLEKDMASLVKSRDELREVDKIERSANLKFLESFIRCFNKTYTEAYDPSCK
jgi:hypothetical protein